jgi:hypothetical protein
VLLISTCITLPACPTPPSLQAEADELRGSTKDLSEEVEALQRKLDAALTAHEDTLHQLEIARFFLQV